MDKKKVVVTGLGVVCPLGNDVKTFWEGIRAGRCGIGEITRFDASRLNVKVAGEVRDFDVSQYMDPKEAKRLALFAQYAVAASKQAWVDSGLDQANVDPQRVGVVLGVGIGGKEVDGPSYKTLFDKGPARLSPITIPKLIANEGPGNVSIALNAKGPVLTVVTACSASTDALGVAMDMIRAGRADVVVSGGAESTVEEYCIGGFQAMHALSTNPDPLKACRPFDKDRDGFIMSEGSAILILESEASAKARGAKIYGEIAGYGAGGDAFHIVAPDPAASGIIHAERMALADAGVQPEEVQYINAHGTSTGLNDPMETRAAKEVFGAHAYKLKMSSTKSMTGHLLGATGGLEAMVCLLAMRDGFYPPTINLCTPDPECDLDYVANHGVEGTIDVAMSNTLGFGGHNSSLVFKKYRA
ncbi:MAG: beta-ketoacyl-ACP synthase II [Kiritimatiellia bacterium]